MPNSKTRKAAAPQAAAQPAAQKAAAPAKAPRAPSKKSDVKPNAQPAAKPVRKPAGKPAAKPATQAAAPATPAKRSRAAAPVEKKPAKARVKLVRDGFTMPEADFALIATLKQRALAVQREVKKSELLRAGLRVLAALDAKALLAALAQLEPVKTGRPKKGH